MERGRELQRDRISDDMKFRKDGEMLGNINEVQEKYVSHLQPLVLGLWERKQPPLEKPPEKTVYSEKAGFNFSMKLKES